MNTKSEQELIDSLNKRELIIYNMGVVHGKMTMIEEMATSLKESHIEPVMDAEQSGREKALSEMTSHLKEIAKNHQQ